MGSKKLASDLTPAQLRSLQREWYAKAKASGFEDAEDTARADRPLKHWHSTRFLKQTRPMRREATETYYEMCRAIIHTFPFKTPRHRKIWELHSEGKSRRDIAREVGYAASSPVGRIIAKIAKDAGIKK